MICDFRRNWRGRGCVLTPPLTTGIGGRLAEDEPNDRHAHSGDEDHQGIEVGDPAVYVDGLIRQPVGDEHDEPCDNSKQYQSHQSPGRV